MELLIVLLTFYRVSLIAGLEYGMEWWNGKWNGTMNRANSCNWHCSSRLSYIPTVSSAFILLFFSLFVLPSACMCLSLFMVQISMRLYH